MDLRIAFAPARPVARTLAVIAATAAFALATVAVNAQTYTSRDAGGLGVMDIDEFAHA